MKLIKRLCRRYSDSTAQFYSAVAEQAPRFFKVFDSCPVRCAVSRAASSLRTCALVDKECADNDAKHRIRGKRQSGDGDGPGGPAKFCNPVNDIRPKTICNRSRDQIPFGSD